MDSTDQRKAHTPGHESHGVYVCHKCGWPFPNPHPSAKHRRAHKKICGTIEGYKLCFSEGQTRSNASDDEHASDDDHRKPGPKALDTGNTEKGSNGIGEKINRSEDEVFSDAVADFSDSGLSQGVKEPLQEGSLDSSINVEGVDEKDPKFPGSSEDNDVNDADVSQLTVESTDDCEIPHPKILHGERVEVGNTLELQGQLSGTTVGPLSNSVADLRAEESTVVHGDDSFGLSTKSHPSKAEAMPDVLPANEIYAGENVTDSSLTSAAVETNLKGKDEIKSDRDEIEIVVPSGIVVGETCEGVSKIADNNAVHSDHQVAEGTFNPKEKNSDESLSVLVQDYPSLGSNSVVITNASTNDVQVESANVIQFANSCDVEILQGKEEGNANVNTLPTSEDTTDVQHSQSEYEDGKGVVSQNPSSLHSSDTLKHEEDDFKDIVSEENNSLFSPSQLTEKSDILSLDMHVMNSSGSMNKETVSDEPTAEEYTEVSPVKLTVESSQRSYEIGVSTNATKSEMNENHMVHFSEEPGPVDVENSQKISLPESVSMDSSVEDPRDTSFVSMTSEATRVVSIDNISHHENNKTEINDVAVDGKDVVANLENDFGTQIDDLQPSDLLQFEVKQSNDVIKSDDAGEMDKNENFDITDAQCRETATNQIESPVISEAVIDGSTGKSKGIECTNIALLSGAEEDLKEDKLNSNVKVHEECTRSVGTYADSHQARDAELLVKDAEDLAEKYASLSSTNAEPSAQCGFAVEDNQDGQPGRELSGVTAMPVQDQSGNNLVKHSSSGIDASVVSGSRCDSLEANWGSVSVLSMQSDAPAVIDAETSPPTGLVASTEAGRSNLNNQKAASGGQQSGKSEMFEAPSFMTLVKPGHAASHKAPVSEGQKWKNPQQPSSSLQAGWFPSLTQITNESQGRCKNEEIIAKVTNWGSGKEHTPLKSLLGEAADVNKPRSPRLEANSASRKNGKVLENNGSGLTTVNSILGPESPVAQAAIGDVAEEWNSPARYPTDMKREKRKSKSRPYWIQLVCCSSVDLQRR